MASLMAFDKRSRKEHKEMRRLPSLSLQGLRTALILFSFRNFSNLQPNLNEPHQYYSPYHATYYQPRLEDPTRNARFFPVSETEPVTELSWAECYRPHVQSIGRDHCKEPAQNHSTNM